MHIVESYREGKTVKKRRIASLGNIDAYSETEIQQFIRTLESLLHARVTGSLADLNPQSTLSFGVPHVVQFLWEQLELTQAIQSNLHDRDISALCAGHGHQPSREPVEQVGALSRHR